MAHTDPHGTATDLPSERGRADHRPIGARAPPLRRHRAARPQGAQRGRLSALRPGRPVAPAAGPDRTRAGALAGGHPPGARRPALRPRPGPAGAEARAPGTRPTHRRHDPGRRGRARHARGRTRRRHHGPEAALRRVRPHRLRGGGQGTLGRHGRLPRVGQARQALRPRRLAADRGGAERRLRGRRPGAGGGARPRLGRGDGDRRAPSAKHRSLVLPVQRRDAREPGRPLGGRRPLRQEHRRVRRGAHPFLAAAVRANARRQGG